MSKEFEKPASQVVQDLISLRNLSSQLKRIAPTADEQILRAILGKREALLTALRSNLTREEEDERITFAGLAEEERHFMAETVSQINDMDKAAAEVLKSRAEDVASEIQKVRAGRQWRENSDSWK